MDIYNFSTQTWTTGTTGGTGRVLPAATEYNGSIYIWGGFVTSAAVNTMDVYNIATNTWTTGITGGVARYAASSFIYNGQMYIWGGINAAGTVINTMDIYDPINQTWSVGVAGGTARAGQVGGIYNNKVYEWGGTNGTNAINTMDIYDLTSQTWSVGTTGGTARYYAPGVIYNGRLYDWGGNTGAASLNTTDIYDFGSSKVNDVFYIANGQGVGPGNGNLFRFDAAGRAYTSQQGGWYSNGADYAEYMKTTDQDLVPAELVSLNTGANDSIQRTKIKSDKELIGVVSTSPGFVGNISVNVDNSNPNFKLIAMTGQLPVKVNTENGNIAVGDSITSSSTPGQGMKANVGDSTIGIAEEGATAPGLILVLITRDNRGISNSLANLAKINWVGLNNQITTTDKTGVGLPSSYILNTNLEVANGIKILDPVSGTSTTTFTPASIDFTNAGVDVGIRLGGAGLEYKATGTSNWQAISGAVIDNYTVNAGVASSVNNMQEVNGWGYLGAGINTAQVIYTQQSYATTPNLVFNLTGKSLTKPTSTNSCSPLNNNTTATVYNVDKTKFTIGLTPTDSINYYCYSWIILGK